MNITLANLQSATGWSMSMSFQWVLIINDTLLPPPIMFRKNTQKSIQSLAKDRKVIISIDRLDYTKGIPQRIKAFSRFLQKHPEYHRKVTLVLIVVPSRSNVEQYKELQQEIDTLVGHINGKYSEFDWVPVHYFYRALSFQELTTFYQIADIALITSAPGWNESGRQGIYSQ